MIDLVPLTAAHRADLFEEGERWRLSDEWLGEAAAIVEDGNALGVLCLSVLDTGEYRVCMTISDELRERPLALHRGVVRGLAALRALGRPIVAEAENEIGAAWLTRLGFRQEKGRWLWSIR